MARRTGENLLTELIGAQKAGALILVERLPVFSLFRLPFLFLCLVAIPLAAFPMETGTITGSVDRGSSLLAASAMDRSSGKQYAGKLEANSDKFRVEGLPLGATYDVILDFDTGRLEGVNMKVPLSEYEDEQPLSEDDIATIREKVLSLNKFEDVVEILAIDGNIQHAAVLLNKLRTKPFYESKPGEIIWRPELWHFERPEDTWVKVQDELFVVLYRERVQRADFDKKSLTFDSALGGLQPTEESVLLDVASLRSPEVGAGIRYRGVGSQAAK